MLHAVSEVSVGWAKTRCWQSLLILYHGCLVDGHRSGDRAQPVPLGEFVLFDGIVSGPLTNAPRSLGTENSSLFWLILVSL